MNTPIAGGAAALLLVWFLLVRRRPRQLLRSTDGGAIAALNRQQIAALEAGPLPADAAGLAACDASGAPCPMAVAALADLPSPADQAAQVRLRRQLELGFSAAPAQRLAAIRTARVWGHRCVLPLLRRGLRDADPAVVRESALAIERFRGQGPVHSGVSLQLPLPRNVARTL
jgi:hypothetical protein